MKKKNKSLFQPYYNWDTQKTELSINDDFLIDDKGKIKMRILGDVACDSETGKIYFSTPLFGSTSNQKKKK